MKQEQYDALPKVEWDGTTPVYSDTKDRFFADQPEISDYTWDAGVMVEDLQLLICVPTHLSTIDDTYWEDELDGQDLPEVVQIALDHLNEVIRDAPSVGWEPVMKGVKL